MEEERKLYVSDNPNKRKKRKKRYTPKQHAFARLVGLKGYNLTQAADEVYDCATRESARVVGSVTYRAVENLIGEKYDKYGLTEEFLVTALMEDIEAKKGNRKAELDLATKLRGMQTEKKTVEHSGKMGIENLFAEIDDTKRITK
jgi:hypothetical protein